MASLGQNSKKRIRTEEQMHHNRIAQQLYRERKKMEQEQLQETLAKVTQQWVQMQAIKTELAALNTRNATLLNSVRTQAEHIIQLKAQSEKQAADLQICKQELTAANALNASQQRVIVLQTSNLNAQEQMISTLKKWIQGQEVQGSSDYASLLAQSQAPEAGPARGPAPEIKTEHPSELFERSGSGSLDSHQSLDREGSALGLLLPSTPSESTSADGTVTATPLLLNLSVGALARETDSGMVCGGDLLISLAQQSTSRSPVGAV